MIFNLFFLAFCIFIAWLLFRYPLKNAIKPGDYQKLLLFFWVLFGFVLFNSILAFFGMGGLKNVNSQTAIADFDALVDKRTNDGVIIIGKVSDKNEFITGDYIAYVDDNHLWSPIDLWIDLNGGSIAISNNTYQPTEWPVDARGFSYLSVNQTVTVVGYVENIVSLFDGGQSQSIRADIVFGGPFEEFSSRAKIKQVFAAAMVIVNLFVAIMIFLLPIQDCKQGIKRTG